MSHMERCVCKYESSGEGAGRVTTSRCGDTRATKGDGKCAKSRQRGTVRITGYGDNWEKQIRLEGDTGDRSVNGLAGLVANKVRDFIFVSSSISAPIVALKKALGTRLKCQQIRRHMRKMEDR